jgi:hypothetical protein
MGSVWFMAITVLLHTARHKLSVLIEPCNQIHHVGIFLFQVFFEAPKIQWQDWALIFPCNDLFVVHMCYTLLLSFSFFMGRTEGTSFWSTHAITSRVQSKEVVQIPWGNHDVCVVLIGRTII